MVGKTLTRISKERSVKDKNSIRSKLTEDANGDNRTKRNGNRSIVRSFFSPDSSVISKMRRETEYQETDQDNIKIDQDIDIYYKEEDFKDKQLKINIAAKVI